MSQATNRLTDPEMGDSGIQAIAVGDHSGLSHSTPNQPLCPPPEESDLGDISGSIYSMYSKFTEEEDNNTARRCQKDANGVLIFTGLFSAAVAALLTVSVQDLRQSPQANSEFYLGNIYHILANQSINVSPTSIPSLVAQPPTFSPPKCAIWVNSLWFLSLVISLIGTLSATLLQQWARQYIWLTQPAQCSIEKRARIRAFFADGVDKMGLPRAMEALPALLHLSLFLFFSGLVVFLYNVNQTVSLAVTWCIGFFSVVYVCITFMPMLWHNSPYYTPLSTPASYVALVILSVIACLVFYILLVSAVYYGSLFASLFLCYSVFYLLFSPETGYLRRGGRHNSLTLRDRIKRACWIINARYGMLFWFPLNCLLRLLGPIFRKTRHWISRLWNKRTAIEKIILEQSPRIDLGILTWTIGAVGKDDTLEELLKVIPGFLDAHVVKGFEVPIPDMLGSQFFDSICGFLGRNLLSDSIDEETKTRRSTICMNAVDKMCDSRGIKKILLYISPPRFNQVRSIQAAQILSRWCASSDRRVLLSTRQSVACILSYIPERDDHWIALAKDQLGIPKHVLQDNVIGGNDCVSLYFFLYMTREVIRTDSWDLIDLTFLSRLSKFDIHNALPGMRNDFCALWNEIVLYARSAGRTNLPLPPPFIPFPFSNHVSLSLLRDIRHHYIKLHQGTEAAPIAFSATTVSANPILSDAWYYPLCGIATHHPNLSGPPPTHLDDPHHPSPDSDHLESRPTPGGSTVLQQVEEVFPTPFQATDPVHIAPQAPSVTVPSTHEYFEMVPLDLNRLVSTEASGLSRQSSLSTADSDLTPNSVRSDERAPDMLIDGSEENPQTPAATSFTDPVLVTVTSSTVPRPPSVTVQQPDTNNQQGIAAPNVASDITQISSAAYQTPYTISSVGATLQTNEESTACPPTTVSGSRSSPIIVPAFHSGVMSLELPSFVEFALVQPDDISHAPGPPLSPPVTAFSDNSPDVTALDPHVFASRDPPSTHDTRDVTHSIPTTVVSHYVNQPAPATPDTVPSAIRGDS